MIRGVAAMSFRIRGIEESSVYQDILQKGGEGRKGRAEEARKILIRHGTKKFGPPHEQAKAQIAALADSIACDELGRSRPRRRELGRTAGIAQSIRESPPCRSGFAGSRSLRTIRDSPPKRLRPRAAPRVRGPGPRGGEGNPDRPRYQEVRATAMSRPRPRSRPWPNLDRLEELIDRILDVTSWDELLASPSDEPS